MPGPLWHLDDDGRICGSQDLELVLALDPYRPIFMEVSGCLIALAGRKSVGFKDPMRKRERDSGRMGLFVVPAAARADKGPPPRWYSTDRQ